ncbi:unnamed protein product [Brassica oleracea var. botrytis]|uniref:(rape) hypothetical protein n=1 Tax=Brassica napus TaxID=3708 RepID=A0A816IDL1_BRANA|nr:unnamed protein product [Brassica napus]
MFFFVRLYNSFDREIDFLFRLIRFSLRFGNYCCDFNLNHSYSSWSLSCLFDLGLNNIFSIFYQLSE